MNKINKSFLIGFFVVANSVAGLMGMDEALLGLKETARRLKVALTNGMIPLEDRNVYAKTAQAIENVINLKPKKSVDQLEEKIKDWMPQDADKARQAFAQKQTKYEQAVQEMVQAQNELLALKARRDEASKIASCIAGSSSRKK
ncbi:MAG: hypothetical protein ACXWL2_01065 [Candidatus Chromulinivorax sp.]